MPSLPYLKFHLSSPSSVDYGWITLGGERVYLVVDVDEFQKALGYTDEIRKNGWMFDEFIWSEYTKDHCIKSPAELQARIARYLNVHSTAFRDKYGEQFESWHNGFDR